MDRQFEEINFLSSYLHFKTKGLDPFTEYKKRKILGSFNPYSSTLYRRPKSKKSKIALSDISSPSPSILTPPSSSSSSSTTVSSTFTPSSIVNKIRSLFTTPPPPSSSSSSSDIPSTLSIASLTSPLVNISEDAFEQPLTAQELAEDVMTYELDSDVKEPYVTPKSRKDLIKNKLTQTPASSSNTTVTPSPASSNAIIGGTTKKVIPNQSAIETDNNIVTNLDTKFNEIKREKEDDKEDKSINDSINIALHQTTTNRGSMNEKHQFVNTVSNALTNTTPSTPILTETKKFIIEEEEEEKPSTGAVFGNAARKAENKQEKKYEINIEGDNNLSQTSTRRAVTRSQTSSLPPPASTYAPLVNSQTSVP